VAIIGAACGNNEEGGGAADGEGKQYQKKCM